MTKFIGDVHGKFNQYKKLIRENRDTIQVGDLGIGFRQWPHGEWKTNPPYDTMVEANARFIRGNHDNPSVCRNNTQWIKDGTVEGDCMFVGGAFSIDYQYRYSEFTWWEDEQLKEEEFMNISQVYREIKPRIMVTHDCPHEVIAHIPTSAKYSIPPSYTNQMLSFLWNEHRPEIWVFGHHHHPLDIELMGTRFICLDELEMKEI
jgi:predicted phosphodiesterase